MKPAMQLKTAFKLCRNAVIAPAVIVLLGWPAFVPSAKEALCTFVSAWGGKGGDGYKDRIRKFDRDGAFLRKWGGPFAMNLETSVDPVSRAWKLRGYRHQGLSGASPVGRVEIVAVGADRVRDGQCCHRGRGPLLRHLQPRETG